MKFSEWISRYKWVVIACVVALFAVSQCVNSCSRGNALRVKSGSEMEMGRRIDSLENVVAMKDDTIRTLGLIVSERDKMIEELRKANLRPIKINIPNEARK